MTKRVVLTIAILATLGLTPVGAPRAAWAQNVRITPPEPTTEPRVVTPALLYEKRPSDDRYYLGIPPSVPYDPAFVEPVVLNVETPDSSGRIGLSGWTSPNPPIGSSGNGQHEINGWLGFGVSWTWGGPPPKRPSGAAGDAPGSSKQ
jgi:hypothetical protein